MARKVWNRTGRLNGSDAGRMARPVWLCSNCRCWHTDRDTNNKLLKPVWCKFCQRPEFDYFHSSGEASAWCALHLRVKAGEVRNLRRQVPIDLLTVAKSGMARVWAQAVLDFAYDELVGGEWVAVTADYKPTEGISPDAALKIRCLDAMGIPVRIINSNGEV